MIADKTMAEQPKDFNKGALIYKWMEDLYEYPRSILGLGVRMTLGYIKNIIPELVVHSIRSGTKVFDWTIPDEWSISSAYISDLAGNKIVDYKNNNLHVVGYSEQMDTVLSLEDLQKNLYSIEAMPEAIPYVTSYYERRWGFCVTHKQREKLKDANYHVFIDSKFYPGELNYGELVIPGQSGETVFISTYVCHPSMANNELSGPTVTTALAQFILALKSRRYTYRIVFLPETIGSISYLSQHLEFLKKNVVAGFNITCVGDSNCYSYLPSRKGDTLSDILAKHVLKHTDPNYVQYSWLDRGSDERQYCAPGIDLPIVNLMRSKFGTYKEYHTSLDNMNFVSPEGLDGSYRVFCRAVNILENNYTYRTSTFAEPQLSKRSLYPTLSTTESREKVRIMMDFLSYCDGYLSCLDIAEKINVAFWDLEIVISILLKHELIIRVD